MMDLRAFQQWLVNHSADIDVDGRRGPATRAAIIATFANRQAPAASEAEKSAIAGRLGGTLRQLNAVARVESAGGGFLDTGQPKALYERHYFWKRVQIKIPFLSDPSPGGYTIDADKDGINDSWEKIADAAMRNPIAAFESASFGKFQIMGAWATRLGYANAIEFAWALSRTELAHYEALARYIEKFGLRGAFCAISTSPSTCEAFAAGYNGKGFRKFNYHTRIAEGMK